MLTDKQKSRAVWSWNKSRDLRKAAIALGVTVDEVRDYLETCRGRGYPDRIRLYTPSSAEKRLAPSIPALPKGWG
jgi:hypothetical protein